MTDASRRLDAIEKLSSRHFVDGFDCGKPALDQFLKRFALVSQHSGATQTYVVCRGTDRVVGYYSLCVGGVDHAEVSDRVRKGLAKHPIPVMLIARLAVDRSEQGRGLGLALLKNALLRTVQAADIAGIRALLVHAKDDEARQWYLNLDFEASPTDPYHLFLLIKDVRAILTR